MYEVEDIVCMVECVDMMCLLVDGDCSRCECSGCCERFRRIYTNVVEGLFDRLECFKHSI